MSESTTRLGANGRIVLPAAYRKALGLAQGDELVLTLEDDALRIMSLNAAIRRAQAIVRQYIPEGTRLSDELLADRRVEAAHE
ncbi:MAG: AbrB/MazE/SpoVT family DNA-binding domain-containing protein [Ardenticatenales bacterium]|jgi:AbrB family looped-hinge helix DNA binding protein|nr:AbrB/MazE/SpoVT family DNA-binding domain-containing protein [Ardenticatenales bacterium]